MFSIYKNEKLVGKTSKPKSWVKENVISTHMGQWINFSNGDFEYATTIGEYYKFKKES